jgi:short-subunit dehydrogenase
VISGTQIAYQQMKQLGKGGVIINIGSMGGLIEMPYTPVYAAAKVSGYTSSSRSY